MSPLLLGLLFGLLAITGVLIGAGIVQRVREAWPGTVPSLLAFASGTLLSAAFVGMLPEATATLSVRTAMLLTLAGVLLFFLLEKTLIWRHCHDPSCPTHSTAGYMILIGDGFHNVGDGLIIGAAFAADARLGTMIGIAVLAHEIPQEVGDYALLLDGGFSPARALAYNLISASTMLPGIVAGNLLGRWIDTASGVVLAIAAGGFLYLALADLIPELHQQIGVPVLRNQIVPLLLGVGAIWGIGLAA